MALNTNRINSLPNAQLGAAAARALPGSMGNGGISVVGAPEPINPGKKHEDERSLRARPRRSHPQRGSQRAVLNSLYAGLRVASGDPQQLSAAVQDDGDGEGHAEGNLQRFRIVQT